MQCDLEMRISELSSNNVFADSQKFQRQRTVRRSADQVQTDGRFSADVRDCHWHAVTTSPPEPTTMRTARFHGTAATAE